MAKTREQMRAFLEGMDFATLIQDFHEPGGSSIMGSSLTVEQLMNNDVPVAINDVCTKIKRLEANTPGFHFGLNVEILGTGAYIGATIVDREDDTELMPYANKLVNKRQPNGGSAPPMQLWAGANAFFNRIEQMVVVNELRLRDLISDKEMWEAKTLARGFVSEPIEQFRKRVAARPRPR